MRLRLRLPRAAVGLALAATAATVAAQPANHIGQDAAAILIANGCEMAEAALAEAMQAQGLAIGDFQAQVMALNRGGYLTSDTPGELRLTGWPPCS